MRRGVTLVELMVALAILTIAAGVASVAIPSVAPANARDLVRAQIARGRSRAIATGEPVTMRVRTDSAPDTVATATAFPDGSVIADPSLDIDPLPGVPRPVAPDHAHAP